MYDDIKNKLYYVNICKEKMLSSISYVVYIITFLTTYSLSRWYKIRRFSSFVLSLIVSLTVYLSISPEDQMYGITSGDIYAIIISLIYLFTVFIVMFYCLRCILHDRKLKNISK